MVVVAATVNSCCWGCREQFERLHASYLRLHGSSFFG